MAEVPRGGESILNDGTGSAAYGLVLTVLLPTLGLAEASGRPRSWTLRFWGLPERCSGLSSKACYSALAWWVSSSFLTQGNDGLVVITI